MSNQNLYNKPYTGFNRGVVNLYTPMVKPVGGRGMRASYKTKMVRCPEPMQPAVRQLIEDYHERGGILQRYTNVPLEEAIVIAAGILTKRVSAKTAVLKLLASIYGVNVDM
jgi:hypothetical protein